MNSERSEFIIYGVGTDRHGLHQLTGEDNHPHNWLRWSPDGHYIVFKGMRQYIWLAELAVP